MIMINNKFMKRRNIMMESENSSTKSSTDLESGNNTIDVPLIDNNPGEKVFKIFCIVCFSIPIMVCDLYFGSREQECLDMYFGGVHINFRSWILVNGFIGTLMVIAWCTAVNNDFILFYIKKIYVIVSVFVMSWTIIGAIIFWKYLEPIRSCDKELTNYILARIIIGLISAFFNIVNCFKLDI